MAPEAILDPRSVDARADIYGVGAVGYYLRTGAAVADADGTREILRRQLETTPEFPQAGADSIEAGLDGVLAQCLAKTREARPRSAEEVMAALRGLAELMPWTQEQAAEWWSRYQEKLG